MHRNFCYSIHLAQSICEISDILQVNCAVSSLYKQSFELSMTNSYM